MSDIYLTEEQAKFLSVPPEKSFRCSGSGPLDETALRLVAKLDEKLSKQSYARVYADRGKGILLLACQPLPERSCQCPGCLRQTDCRSGQMPHHEARKAQKQKGSAPRKILTARGQRLYLWLYFGGGQSAAPGLLGVPHHRFGFTKFIIGLVRLQNIILFIYSDADCAVWIITAPAWRTLYCK